MAALDIGMVFTTTKHRVACKQAGAGKEVGAFIDPAPLGAANSPVKGLMVIRQGKICYIY
jgi:hypothetical protein